MGLALDNAAVILDEAHNVESTCRDAGSLELTLLDMVAMASGLCDLTGLSSCGCACSMRAFWYFALLCFGFYFGM